MVLSTPPFICSQILHMSVHTLDKCVVNLVLIGTELSISTNGTSPLLIKGNVAIGWTSIFTEPVGDGCSASRRDMEEEYDAAVVGG